MGNAKLDKLLKLFETEIKEWQGFIKMFDNDKPAKVTKNLIRRARIQIRLFKQAIFILKKHQKGDADDRQ